MGRGLPLKIADAGFKLHFKGVCDETAIARETGPADEGLTTRSAEKMRGGPEVNHADANI